MDKPLFSLGRAVLALSIVLTTLTPVSSLAGRSEQCWAIFEGLPSYQRMNVTARMSAKTYPMPNGRSAHEYEITLLPENVHFRDLVGRGDTIVDLGGGKGQAMSDLAQALPVRTIVINTQDFSELHAKTRFKGSLEYRAGWAEEELKKIPSGSVDMVVDLWGAFAYSPNKAEIIEEVYRILKPGGRATLLHPSKTPATIEDPEFNYGQPAPMVSYLARRFKTLISSRATHHPDVQGARVIDISKPASGEPATIDLELEASSVEHRDSYRAFTSVVYRIKH